MCKYKFRRQFLQTAVPLLLTVSMMLTGCGLPKPFTLILFVLILSKASRAVTLCNSPAFIFTYST